MVLPYISYDMQACAGPNGTVFVTKMGIALVHYDLAKYGYDFKWNHEDVLIYQLFSYKRVCVVVVFFFR